MVFQSAPLTDVRGDASAFAFNRAKPALFQSAPLTDVRGDEPLLVAAKEI